MISRVHRLAESTPTPSQVTESMAMSMTISLSFDHKLSFEQEFFCQTLACFNLGLGYHFCGVLNDVGNRWLLKFERSKIDQREQQMLQSRRLYSFWRWQTVRALVRATLCLPFETGFLLIMTRMFFRKRVLFELQWQKRWWWIIICGMDQAKDASMITDGKNFHWKPINKQSVFRLLKIIEIIWNKAWIVLWLKDQQACENKPLIIDSVTWLGLRFGSDSELTRQMDLLLMRMMLDTLKCWFDFLLILIAWLLLIITCISLIKEALKSLSLL